MTHKYADLNSNIFDKLSVLNSNITLINPNLSALCPGKGKFGVS